MTRPFLRCVTLTLRRGCDAHPRLAALAVLCALCAACSSTTATPPTTTARPGAPVGSSTCLDEQGDATAPPADLTRTELAVDGDDLVVTWTATPPSGANRSYYVQLGTTYQIGVRKIDNGEYIETVGFAFDRDTAKQVDVTPKILPDPGQAKIVVPLSKVPKLTLPVDWTATLTDNTSDLDTCTATWAGPVA